VGVKKSPPLAKGGQGGFPVAQASRLCSFPTGMAGAPTVGQASCARHPYKCRVRFTHHLPQTAFCRPTKKAAAIFIPSRRTSVRRGGQPSNFS
jgi:hypothetical protein